MGGLIFIIMSFSAIASAVGQTALDVGSNYLSSSLSNANQWKYQQKQNAWQAEQNTIAYNRQREFYDYQNEYNTPANQIARLRAAGINPNLAYSNGNLQNVGNSSPSISNNSASTFSTTPYNFGNVGSSFVQGLIQAAQLKNIQKQTDKLEKENQYQDIENKIRLMTWLDEAKSKGATYRATADTIERAALESLRNQSLANNYAEATYESRVNVQLSNQTKAEFESALSGIDYAVQNARMPWRVKSAVIEYQTQLQSLRNLVSMGVLTRAQANVAYSQIALNGELGKLYQQKVNESKATENNTKEDTKRIGLANTREATQQALDFDNPLFTEDGKFNWKGINDFIATATGHAVDIYKAKSGKSKGYRATKRYHMNGQGILTGEDFERIDL